MRKVSFAFLCLLYLGTGMSLTSDLVRYNPPEDSRSDPPVISFARDGTLWMAWPSWQEGRTRILACCRSEGRWSSLFFPDPGLTDQVEPQIVFDAQDSPVLIYSSFDGNEWVIKRTAKTQSAWTIPEILGRGLHPSAVSVNGRILAAWEKDGRIRLFSPEGNGKQPDIRTFDPDRAHVSFSSPCIASGPEGEVWMTWSAAQIGYQSVQLQRIDDNRHPRLVVDDGKGINRNPRLSVDSSGRAWVVYERLLDGQEKGPESWEQSGRPVYQMDRVYGVENPSRVLSVTDGLQWWTGQPPEDPAMGLMPAVFCSRRGPVWLVSRSFTGYSGPLNYFCPVCESLDAGGWTNHGLVWSNGQSYKAFLSMAEDPGGRVWTAWAQHDREKKSFQETPSWTHMDGPDRIFVAPMPILKEGGLPDLIPLAKKTAEPPSKQSFPRFQTTYKGENLRVYFGDLHQHSEISGCGRRNGRIDQNQYYTCFVRGLDFMCTIDHAEHHNGHTWHMTQLAAQMHNRPGKFVTFSGFEWTSEFDGGGNLYRGHYNALFRDVGKGDFYFSASDPRYNTPLELWEALKEAVGGEKNVLTFAHHTSRRMAWLSWNYYDPQMAPLIEIAQARGSYEYEGCFIGLDLDNDCTRVSGHYIRDGLDRGMRWGFIAGGDHGGRQLAAVYASRLDRESIFRGLKNRQAYATSGERIFLDVRVNDHFMGEEFILQRSTRTIEIKATGTAPVVEVDVFRNGRSIRKWVPRNPDVELTLEDKEPLLRRENYYYVRVLQADGGQAWSSPIWTIVPRFEGEFRFQVGGDELRVIYPDEETDFAILMHNEKETRVRGSVVLDIPDGWTVREKEGIQVDCPPGSWKHAVFHVKAPPSSLSRLCLPSVRARFVFPDGHAQESPLFVVGSSFRLSREQKAVLIDARTEIPEDGYQEYIERIAAIWQKEL